METEQAQAKPGAGLVTSLSWTVVAEALQDMPTLFLSALVVNGAIQALQWAVNDRMPIPTPGQGPIARAMGIVSIYFVVYAAQSLVLASVAVAIHRLILRDEKADHIIAPFKSHTLRFAAWLTGLQLLWTLVLLAAPMRAIGGIGLLAVAMVAVGIAILFVTTRLSLMFPAIAIEAPAASLRQRIAASWALSRGRFWLLFGSGLLALVPLFIGMFILGLAVFAAFALVLVAAGEPVHDLGSSMSWPKLILDDISRVMTAALGAAVLSWNYRIAQMERAGVDFSPTR
ncbi:MAG TPA: hypothetical protein VII56_20770 [Rhizomicrobium sp.]